MLTVLVYVSFTLQSLVGSYISGGSQGPKVKEGRYLVVMKQSPSSAVSAGYLSCAYASYSLSVPISQSFKTAVSNTERLNRDRSLGQVSRRGGGLKVWSVSIHITNSPSEVDKYCALVLTIEHKSCGVQIYTFLIKFQSCVMRS